MKTLIINADDFGMTEGVSEGIVRAIDCGVLTTTSAMLCVPGSASHVARWAPKIAGRVGLHLQLTSGRPVLDAERVPSLVRPDGIFPGSRKEALARRKEEIVMEWHAQMQALLATGVEPTHLDTHHHMHREAGVWDAYLEIAAHYGLPARAVDEHYAKALRGAGVYTVDRTLLDWFGGELTVHRLMQILVSGTSDLDDGCVVELMTHPAIVSPELPGLTKYVEDRERELNTLCRPELPGMLAAGGFRLASYQQLRSADAFV